MRLISDQRFLAIYCAVLTAVFAITVFGGFTTSRKLTLEMPAALFSAAPTMRPRY
jgi:hypothetical protein